VLSYTYSNTKIMKREQTRGAKFLNSEIAYLKYLLQDRFLNDTQVCNKFNEVVGKTISRKHVNHIRNGIRWNNIQPSNKKDFL